MKTYRFKTSINCSGCVAKLTPFIEARKDINSWKVDTSSPDKILTVETGQLTAEAIKALVQNAGFRAESLDR